MAITEECSEFNFRYPIDSIIPYQGIIIPAEIIIGNCLVMLSHA